MLYLFDLFIAQGLRPTAPALLNSFVECLTKYAQLVLAKPLWPSAPRPTSPSSFTVPKPPGVLGA